jgi:hypothetical protein
MLVKKLMIAIRPNVTAAKPDLSLPAIFFFKTGIFTGLSKHKCGF